MQLRLASLSIGPGGDVTAKDEEGARLFYRAGMNGGFTPDPSVLAALARAGSGYQVTTEDLVATAPVSLPTGVAAAAGSLASGFGAVSVGASSVSTVATCVAEGRFNGPCATSTAATLGSGVSFLAAFKLSLGPLDKLALAGVGQAFTGLGLIGK